jgi:hypothetical protein
METKRKMRIIQQNQEWWSLDAELPHTVFFGHSRAECIREAERRGIEWEDFTPESNDRWRFFK